MCGCGVQVWCSWTPPQRPLLTTVPASPGLCGSGCRSVLSCGRFCTALQAAGLEGEEQQLEVYSRVYRGGVEPTIRREVPSF